MPLTSVSAARKLLLLGIRQKVHSGYEVNVWEDLWIPITPARLARPAAPVLHPNMRVIDLINQGIEGMGYSITGGLCCPCGYTFYKKLGHKLSSSSGHFLLELH
ncbi:hypothetical protein F2Q70_00015811 [Brassica cretica]|uniref:Uncharacterized protein n=1 Tax=Brassica cretica TaxID=69181 RepID=A0A8S9I778_BRACR|nr:hypothetical protein F2Q70_00015811 [Brassica cretica]